MTTITINERTKAGKSLLELIKILSDSNQGIIIKNELKHFKQKKEYDSEFVKMVLKAHKSKERITINPYNIWENIK